MFMLRNVSKYLFGDTSKESIIEIPQGQLYLVRPLSPKGYSELIYKDAVASIRRTGQEFQYQLIVQRAYEEGESDLADDEDEGGEGLDKDEKTFLLDQALRFRAVLKDSGEKILAWSDLSGDPGDLFEFVCDSSVPGEKVTTFELAAVECQYERKYRRSAQKATEADLREFSFSEAEPIPAASPAAKQIESGPTSKESATRMAKDVKSSKKANTALPRGGGATSAPPANVTTRSGEVLTKQAAELHLFDFESGTFILQDASVVATVLDVGKWQYWLEIDGPDKKWLDQQVIADINPVFNFEYLSFIFNHYLPDGSAYSWLLRFPDQATIEQFQEGLMQALWEQLNEIKWAKVKDQEKEYVLDAFNDLTMDDAPGAEAEAQEEDEDEDDDEEEADKPRAEQYDEDESEDDVELDQNDGNVNSQLAVGNANDRSYVIRGNSIGVFKHAPNKHLEFSTNITGVKDSKGRLFSPKKVMLHARDTQMVLQDQNNPNSLFPMDLEYGKIVGEWKIHDDIPITSFAPETKFAQTTNTNTFLGISGNALYQVDPRLSGTKLNLDKIKEYASKNDFSAIATTDKGYVAVASNKGDIRLFDRVGIQAKTLIPALGDPIIGIDTSADGRYILATCRTYILLIDNLQKSGKNEGKLGFEKSFAKDSKPTPRRLALSPSHAAQFQHETRTPLSFTVAHFNRGVDQKETSIITATGPWIIAWDFKKVLAGTKDPYKIRRYEGEVKADNFEYGSDKNVIMALPDEVNMVSRKALKKPTRESILGPLPRGSLSGSGPKTPRRSGRASGLREEIVNSPY